MIVEADDFTIWIEFSEAERESGRRASIAMLNDAIGNTYSGFEKLQSVLKRAKGKLRVTKQLTSDGNYLVTVVAGEHGVILYQQKFFKRARK